jgi:hypothetical protein
MDAFISGKRAIQRASVQFTAHFLSRHFQPRILYRLHRSYGIDRRYFDPAAPKILHHDVTGQHCADLILDLQRLCASAGLHAPRMR